MCRVTDTYGLRFHTTNPHLPTENQIDDKPALAVPLVSVFLLKPFYRDDLDPNDDGDRLTLDQPISNHRNREDAQVLNGIWAGSTEWRVAVRRAHVWLVAGTGNHPNRIVVCVLSNRR